MFPLCSLAEIAITRYSSKTLFFLFESAIMFELIYIGLSLYSKIVGLSLFPFFANKRAVCLISWNFETEDRLKLVSTSGSSSIINFDAFFERSLILIIRPFSAISFSDTFFPFRMVEHSFRGEPCGGFQKLIFLADYSLQLVLVFFLDK